MAKKKRVYKVTSRKYLSKPLLRELLQRVANEDGEAVSMLLQTYWWFISSLANVFSSDATQDTTHGTDIVLKEVIASFIGVACALGREGAEPDRLFQITCEVFVEEHQERRVRRIIHTLTRTPLHSESLDAPLGEDTERSLHGMISCTLIPSPEESTYHYHTRTLTQRLLTQEGIASYARLTKVQLRAIELHYLEGYSIADTARILNTTREKARNKIDTGLRKLRSTAREYAIHDVEIGS